MRYVPTVLERYRDPVRRIEQDPCTDCQADGAGKCVHGQRQDHRILEGQQSNVVAVANGAIYIALLRDDGTVLCLGNDALRECETSNGNLLGLRLRLHMNSGKSSVKFRLRIGYDN